MNLRVQRLFFNVIETTYILQESYRKKNLLYSLETKIWLLKVGRKNHFSDGQTHNEKDTMCFCKSSS